MKALTLTLAGTVESLELDRDSELAQLQAAVGGWIQMLTLPDGVAMVFDEEGKLKDSPVNQTATALTAHFALGLMPGDVIVGDAVLVGVDRGGNTTDIPEAAFAALNALGIPTPNV